MQVLPKHFNHLPFYLGFDASTYQGRGLRGAVSCLPAEEVVVAQEEQPEIKRALPNVAQDKQHL
jgi:hypothetical protein